MLAVGVTAVLCAPGMVALAPGEASAATWVPTATKALTLKNASLLGAAAPSRALDLTIGLTPRNTAGIQTLIRQQASGQAAYLTPAQFTQRFAATAASAGAVTSYLNAQGMKNVTVSSNRLQVTATATVAQAQRAFHTTIDQFTQAGRTVLANVSAAQVPADLGGVVSGVLGLSSLGPQAGPALGLPKLTGYYPKEFNTVYHSAGTTDGTGTTLAVIAEGDLTPTIADLRLAEKAQGLPQVPVSLVYSGVKSTDTSGADEWDLDTQTSTAVAPKAKRLYVYVATSLTDSDLARSINQFAAQNVATSGSASLGECDLLPYLDGAMTVDDVAFAEAAVQGQTFFASSGDTGSACAVLPTNGVPGAGLPDTEYPASSPYVLGVGGTTLDTDAADAYQTELAWNAGGGGVSPVETSPYWQNGVNLAGAAGLRGVPDVAFDADPNTGASIYVGGVPETIGGTSLASPLALGLWTRIQSSHANRLGFAAPKLYSYYSATQKGLPTTAIPGFHDVVLGANGAYTALPGYDYTTGLGSWDVGVLSSKLK